MTTQQAKAARRKARNDPRYASNRSKDPLSVARRLHEKVERERARQQRAKKKG